MSKRHVVLDEQEIRRLCTCEQITLEDLARRLGKPHQWKQIGIVVQRLGLDTFCWCGIKERDHEKCGGCGILVGPGHITKTVEPFLNRVYCSTCLKPRKKLRCKHCGAYQIWYEHEIVRLHESDIVIDGICCACGWRNRFTAEERQPPSL